MFVDIPEYPQDLRDTIGQRLKPFGFLFGSYVNSCGNCRRTFTGAKRCLRCLECAEKAEVLYTAEEVQRQCTGEGLFTSEIPADWHEDNIILVRRPHVSIMADLSVNGSFWVFDNEDGTEIYSADLRSCIEFVRKYELGESENLSNLTREVDVWGLTVE